MKKKNEEMKKMENGKRKYNFFNTIEKNFFYYL